MSEQDTAPAAETERAESTSMSAILDRDAHVATPAHEVEHEVGHTEPAPAPAVAAAAPAATPAPAPAAAVDPATKPEAEGPFWYRKAIKAERDARQAAEARAAAAERRPAPQQERAPATETEDPDRPLTRAELDFYRNQDALIGRLERSEERFVDKLGDETFEATKEWLTTRPDIEEWALKQRDPWKAAHSQFTKEKLAAEIGEDPNAWREAEKERMRQEIRAEMAAESDPQHTPASRPAAPQMRSALPAPASTARSAAPRDANTGKFTGPTPLSAALGKR